MWSTKPEIFTSWPFTESWLILALDGKGVVEVEWSERTNKRQRLDSKFFVARISGIGLHFL